MTLGKWAVRIVCLIGGVLVSLVLLAFLAVQIQQRMLRWRAERLLADMHQIRLYQSTWTDAQRLMRRWGAWGYYEGSCTAASCEYKIELRNSVSVSLNPRASRVAWLDWLMQHDRLNLYSWLGGRGSVFMASFTVHEGTIWRKNSWIAVSIPRRKVRQENDFEETLSMGAGTRQRLRPTLKVHEWLYIGSSDEGLERHPYYKVGRPGGCTIHCEIGVVYYSTHTPPAEIVRLTSYDFSCFTRFNPCEQLEDLLPAAEEWHLYTEGELNPAVTRPSPLPMPYCDVPVWASARDASYILSVEVLSTKIVKDREYEREMASVRIIASLKDSVPWPMDAVVDAFPFQGSDYYFPPQMAEHLIPGRRFIVFPVGDDRRDRLLTKDSPIRLDRCGVKEDTPEIRHELEKGFAQNDSFQMVFTQADRLRP